VVNVPPSSASVQVSYGDGGSSLGGWISTGVSGASSNSWLDIVRRVVESYHSWLMDSDHHGHGGLMSASAAPALFSVAGVTLGASGGGLRHAGDVGDDWSVGTQNGPATGIKSVDVQAIIDSRAAPAEGSVNWTETAPWVSSLAVGASGSTRSGGQPNLSEFDLQTTKKSQG
jgi:hypothetical protein